MFTTPRVPQQRLLLGPEFQGLCRYFYYFLYSSVLNKPCNDMNDGVLKLRIVTNVSPCLP